MKKIFIVGMFLFVINTLAQAGVQKLNGHYDNGSYTSAAGLFTIAIPREDLKAGTLKDELMRNGAIEKVEYVDRYQDRVSLVATMSTKELPKNFVDTMLANAQKNKLAAQKGKTPDGRDCLVSFELRQDPKTKQYQTKLNVIFPWAKTVFDMTVIGDLMPSEAKAKERTETVYYNTYQNTTFRGIFTPELLQGPTWDPRIMIALGVLKTIAKQKGYGIDVSTGSSAVVRIHTPGKQDPMEISLGLKVGKAGLMTTEAIACAVDLKKKANDLKEDLFLAFGEAMAREKLTFQRSAAFDPELLQKPE